jgi:hypothetical protein
LRPTEPRGVWCTTPNVHASRPSRTSSSSSPSASRPPPPSQANATLQQRRTAITDALASDQNNLRRRLANERRQRLIQLIINGLRILATALATALFFRMLAQPSDQLLAHLERTLEED